MFPNQPSHLKIPSTSITFSIPFNCSKPFSYLSLFCTSLIYAFCAPLMSKTIYLNVLHFLLHLRQSTNLSTQAVTLNSLYLELNSSSLMMAGMPVPLSALATLVEPLSPVLHNASGQCVVGEAIGLCTAMMDPSTKVYFSEVVSVFSSCS